MKPPTTPSPAAPTRIIDSHTGGEPTRVIVQGGPDLGMGTMAERLTRFRNDHDAWRRALMHEPRGHDVLVGAWLMPLTQDNGWGMIFFNNVGYLGMCGHGTIGVVETLAYLGHLRTGEVRLHTPVGTVEATRHEDGSVSVVNVPAYRQHSHKAVRLPDGRTLHGDVAWGGNWFFLCHDHGLTLRLEHLPALETLSLTIRQALREQSITGADGAEIDHIELLGPPQALGNHGRGFVMCPGGAYDRSPCGTGTSAKLACLAADGKLGRGERWRQESVTGSVFEAHYDQSATQNHGLITIIPTIRGRAHITLDATVIFDPSDALTWGFPQGSASA